MTLVNIDITGVASSTGDDDRVVLRAPMIREKTGGGLVDTREEIVHLTQGVGDVTLEPGPVMVKFLCEGVSDTREKMGVVPESEETVDIFDVLSDSLDYPTPVVAAAQRARDEATSAVARIQNLADIAQDAADSASQDATQTDLDLAMTSEARDRAEAAAWRAELTTVGINAVETPPGSGLWAIGSENLTISESESGSGLYMIGAI